MASLSSSSSLIYLLGVLVFFMGSSTAQLSTNFYSNSCPNLTAIVRTTLQGIIAREARMGASLLRLHFHDCFVNGCDGSILLDDTSSFTGEKNAAPNAQSVRGFEHIDTLKSNVETACPGVVSCADILALASSISVQILGGPIWNVKFGRRDARTASQAAANTSIPPPTSSLSQLITSYANVGLSTRDMVALSGGHTIGQARCITFRARIYNETPIDSNFAQTRRSTCPAAAGSGDGNLAPLDVQTPTRFDNNYYRDLVANRGLLHSDQQLFSGGSTDAMVRGYVNNPNTFNSDFAAAMVKMGDISPLTGTAGEIRSNCRRTN